MPDRHQCFRQCAGFLDRQRRRHAHRLTVLRDAVLRITATGDQRHHLVTDLVPLGVAADGHHFAGDFEAGQVAGAGRRRIGAGALRDIGPVDAGGLHLDQDLVGAGLRQRPLFRHQHLRSAGFRDGDHGHLRGQLVHDVSLSKGAGWNEAIA
ncbi:hypothetical protein ACVWZV_000385 [Bradyrhizobium sp. GM5.1]